MVDTVSAEERRKELLEESRKYTYPEDTASIKLRYKDTALVLFKVRRDKSRWKFSSAFTAHREMTC